MSTSRYLKLDELSRLSRLSHSTIHRLKNAGRIPFFQPGGKGSSLRFPPDAIELARSAADDDCQDQQKAADPSNQLSGPQPAWMRNSKTN